MIDPLLFSLANRVPGIMNESRPVWNKSIHPTANGLPKSKKRKRKEITRKLKKWFSNGISPSLKVVLNFFHLVFFYHWAHRPPRTKMLQSTKTIAYILMFHCLFTYRGWFFQRMNGLASCNCIFVANVVFSFFSHSFIQIVSRIKKKERKKRRITATKFWDPSFFKLPNEIYMANKRQVKWSVFFRKSIQW